MALAIAAVPGTDADSPTPSAGSPGRGISSTSSCSTLTHSTGPMPSGNTNVSGSLNGSVAMTYSPLRADLLVSAISPTPAGEGKTTTVVRGLPLDAEALTALGKRLRTACGAGGTAKDGVLEVQGDHVQRVMDWLTQDGWRVKRTGG